MSIVLNNIDEIKIEHLKSMKKNLYALWFYNIYKYFVILVHFIISF